MKTLPPRTGLYGRLLQKPSPVIGWTIPVVLFFMIATLNLVVLSNTPFGIVYTIPLFFCLWSRNRIALYLLATAGSLLMLYKTVFMSTGIALDLGARLVGWCFQIINIWLPALAIHLTVYAFDRLDLKRRLLLESNAELEAANEELAQREEEVVQQNEELHSQAGELERQAEELRQQAEELEQQTVELHAANDELTRRERGLQTLLESARWLRSDLSERDVMSAVCQAAVQVMEEGVCAAAVVHDQNGSLALLGHFGFGVHGTLREEIPFRQTFAHLVMERRQTAYIADIHSRPDIIIPQPAAGRVFRSLLATPLIIEGRVAGAVEVYSQQPREWTDGEFKVIEWLAAQCALALQAIEYQQEVLIKRREAEQASIQKTRFLAAVSHDVRTPANAISLLAELIEQAAKTSDPAAAARGIVTRNDLPSLVHDLKSNARSLVELVSDVLDLARLDTGKRDLQVFPFPLQPLLENEVRHFEHLAAEKQLRITLHSLPDNPVGNSLHLLTDRMKLSRIIANLLGNAVKFTQVGSIDIRTAFTPEGALQISVADTGMGIPRDALPRIFDEFYQIQNPERDRNKGSGLGLAICRRLVDALSCTLSVDSTPGLGTTFTITLPASLIVPPPPAGTAPHDNGDEPFADRHAQSLQDVKVLLVEDHEVTRRAASRLLAAAGATVLEARTGREALHLLLNDQPHVLLLDLMLPDADGADVLKQLRLHRPPALRCVLAVSGDVRDARITEIKDLGADDLLPKPLDIHRLLSAITTRLSPAGNGDR